MIRVRTISPPLGLELHWADRSNAELGYRIARRVGADPVWSLFGITGPDTIFYPDHTVQSGTASLGSLRPKVVNESGTVIGTVGYPYDPTSFVSRSTDSGSPLTAALPTVYKKQVRLPGDSSAWINNQGDIVIGAQVLEGPEDAPVWASETVFWRKANDELFIVRLPEGVGSRHQFNNAGCFSAIATVHILDADGNPVLDGNGNPAFRDVAQILLPVEVDFISRNPETGEYGELGGILSESQPAPKVDVEAQNVRLDAAGNLIVDLTIDIRDPLSEIVGNGAQRLQSLTIYLKRDASRDHQQSVFPRTGRDRSSLAAE